VKHSSATEVWLRLRLEGESLVVLIEDNGKGCASNGGPGTALSQALAGDGLLNMRKRIEDLGGRFEQQGGLGHGMTIQFVVPFAGDTP
jgi:signal transduction histidine kinase